MSNNHDSESEQMLDRHIEALKSEKIPGGPSQQTITSTLAMLRTLPPSPGISGEGGGAGSSSDARKNATVTGRRPFIERLAAMTFPQRLAATVLITIGALIIYLMFALFNSLAPNVAFADVVNKVKAARTLVYRTTVTLSGKPPQVSRTLVSEPNLMRTEFGDGVSITDGKQVLVLQPKLKTALRVDFTGNKLPQANFVEGFRHLDNVKGESLGNKTIDGVKTIGFRTDLTSNPITVWADRKTALPVRIESSYHIDSGDMQVVIDQFQFDPVIDASQFSLDVPQGYTLSQQKLELPKSFKPEDVVADFLRLYTDASGGSFPASLTDTACIAKVFGKGNDKQKAMKIGGAAGAMYGAIFALKDYGYAGKDVKLGEKAKIIFWYKLPGMKNYRALFGDLHTGDATAEQLPATQPSH